MRGFFDSLIKSFFYGNYFYGLCAVALSIEATVQQKFTLNPFYFYTGVFSITTWFYTLSYSKQPDSFRNPRAHWYFKNTLWVKWSQRLLLLTSIVVIIKFIAVSVDTLLNMPLLQWVVILAFPG